MKSTQKALIIKDSPETTHGLDELNVHLSRGWRVAHLAPMGASGTGPADTTANRCFAAIVIIERTEEDDVDVMMQMEEEVGGLIEEIMESEVLEREGDGATIEIEETDFGAERSK